MAEVKKVFLVLADISGYTRFITSHRTSLAHAEKIISELLETIIKASAPPLVLHELEGDAVAFYALSDDARETAQNTCRQVKRFMEAFRAKEAELIGDCELCACSACDQVMQLKLKVVVHYGEAVFTQVQQFNKIGGEDVILAHRLLKNSIKRGEYVILTEAFHKISGDIPGLKPEHRVEECEGLGRVNVLVYYPTGDATVEPARRSRWQKFRTLVRLDAYQLKRLLVKSSKRFPNLERAQQEGVEIAP